MMHNAMCRHCLAEVTLTSTVYLCYQLLQCMLFGERGSAAQCILGIINLCHPFMELQQCMLFGVMQVATKLQAAKMQRKALEKLIYGVTKQGL